VKRWILALFLGGCGEDAGPGDPCAAIDCGNGDCVALGGAASCDCDDGYVDQGLTCVAEGDLGRESEPNDLCGQANGPYLNEGSIDGAFASETDIDWYRIEVGSVGGLQLWTEDVAGDGCGFSSPAGSDTSIAFYGEDCQPAGEGGVWNDNASEATRCSSLQLYYLSPPNPIHIRVEVIVLGEDPRYTLTFTR
jgi:hypothetical protein